MYELLTISIFVILSVAGAFLLVEAIFLTYKLLFGVAIAIKVANHRRASRHLDKRT